MQQPNAELLDAARHEVGGAQQLDQRLAVGFDKRAEIVQKRFEPLYGPQDSQLFVFDLAVPLLGSIVSDRDAKATARRSPDVAPAGGRKSWCLQKWLLETLGFIEPRRSWMPPSSLARVKG